MPSEPANDSPSSADSTEGADKYATYCPEDNKLRLYIGWVERSVYERLRSEGWSATPKQSCDFVAVWTPDRRDTAIELADVILDEDMGPAERAADRAERFSGYLEKRLDEAGARADRFDSGPAVHGYQSFSKAVRSADRHDRIAGRAVDAWEKAEYWTRRTAGVIRNALYKDAPGVRMGRINRLEAELRQREKCLADYRTTYEQWVKASSMEPGEKKETLIRHLVDYSHRDHDHPRLAGVKQSLYSLLKRSDDPITTDEAVSLWLTASPAPKDDSDWTRHLKLRLAYERQMLGEQGSVAAMIDMIPGGWLRGGRHLRNEERRILKVNKSPVTGRVVSVLVQDNHASSVNRWGNPWPDGVAKVLCHQVDVERLAPDAYRAPTDAELADFFSDRKKAKAERPKVETPPLINPTDADAQRLQELLNAANVADGEKRKARNPHAYCPELEGEQSTVCRITQKTYSTNSVGTYAKAETVEIDAGGKMRTGYIGKYSGRAVCKVRVTFGGSYKARRVIILTDKPQNPFPADLWPHKEPKETVAAVAPNPVVEEHISTVVFVANSSVPTGPVAQPEFSL